MSNNCEILDLDVKCDTLVPYYDMGISLTYHQRWLWCQVC